MRMDLEKLFSSCLLLFAPLVLTACFNVDEGPVELVDGETLDLEVFTNAKSARDYMSKDIKYGTLKDPRDGKSYKTVKIGTLTWMAENLNFTDSTLLPNIAGNNWCYNNEPSYCDVGGRLYSWTAAVDAPSKYIFESKFYKSNDYIDANFVRGICPEGWHIPSSEEMSALRRELGDDGEGTCFKSERGWRKGAGDNSTGFTALPVGRMKNGQFLNVGFEFAMWYMSENSSDRAWSFYITYERATINNYSKSSGLSVRCVQDSVDYQIFSLNDSTGMMLGDSNSLSDFLDPESVEKGVLIDPRDGHEYRTIKFVDRLTKRTQEWMAENLAYAGDDVISACYAEQDSNCAKYGRLYIGEKAESKVCPAGTHLPTEVEFRTLMRNFGKNSMGDWSGLALKSREGWAEADNRWKSNGNGVDRYGFTALPGGVQFKGATSYGPEDEGKKAYFWVANPAYTFVLSHSDSSANFVFKEKYLSMASVRCMVGNKPIYHECGATANMPTLQFTGKDSSVLEGGFLHDLRDGKFYQTVTIGKQTWMAENLNFRPTAYGKEIKCYSDDNLLCDTLGALYTWKAAMDVDGMFSWIEDFYCRHEESSWRGICPMGWHLPTKDEWGELVEAVGDSLSANRILKSKTGWTEENGIDNYGFTVIPSGRASESRGQRAYFWTSSDMSYSSAFRTAFDGGAYSTLNRELADKSMAFSVRCVRDTALLSEAVEITKSEFGLGQQCKEKGKDECVYGTVTDERDGRVYKTVKVGLQTWMAENLALEYGNVPVDSLGGFYTWADAMDSAAVYTQGKGCGYGDRCSVSGKVRGICPEGFHLPSQKEWEELIAVVGGKSVVKNRLMSTSGWGENSGSDAFGWNGLPVGYWYPVDGTVHNRGKVAHFWSSWDPYWAEAWVMSLDVESAEVNKYSYVDKANGISIRCIKD